MFPNINPLPRAKRQIALLERNAEIHRRKCRANMCGHIVLSLRRMDEQRIAIVHEPGEKMLKIATNIRVGILLD